MGKYVENRQLMKMLRRFPKELTGETKAVVKANAEKLRDEIANRAPKDTGELSENVGIAYSQGGLTARVGFDEAASGFARKWKKHGFLAIFHEYGTVKMPARPFVRPAYRAVLPNALKDIQAAVKSTIDRASRGDW